jgi:hypothetical protein
MGFFDRMSTGAEIARSSMKVLAANKQLIIFPILSGISLLLIGGSFVFALLPITSWNTDEVNIRSNIAYLIMFLFYLVNYFVVVFFNMALMHCTKQYFDGEEVTISKGLRFSADRVNVIFSWAVFSATVGVLLKVIQDNAGWLGRIITSAIGLVWGVATFFVVPILAYEKLGPVDAVKRSASMMKQKWGESIGSSFSFGLLQMCLFLVLVIVSYGVGYYINEALGIFLCVAGLLMIVIISSALNSIFVSAVYNNINGNISDHFRQQLLDGLFQEK